MKSTIIGLNYIWKHIRKYWISLIIIFVFICFATYFQMLGPKLMGQSFDDIIEYVKLSNIYEHNEQINSDINNLVGLNNEEKSNIANQLQLSGDAKEKWMNATPEQVKLIYNIQIELGYIILSDESISKGTGLSENQISEIEELKDLVFSKIFAEKNITYNPVVVEQSTLFDNILYSSNEELVNIYDNYNSLYVSEEEISQSYEEFKDGIWMFFISILLTMIGMIIYQVLMVFVSSKSQREMRKGLFAKIAELSISFFDRSNDGDLLSRFTNDIDNISNAMSQTFIMIISQGVMLFAIVYMMFKDDTSEIIINGYQVNNILTWTLIVFAFFAIFCAIFIIRKAQKYVSKQQEKLGVLNGFVDERISGQKIVITYGLEEESMEQFIHYNDDYLQNSIKGQIYSGLLNPLMTGVGLVNLGFLVCFGAYFVSNEMMTAGLLLTFIQYSQRFFGPLAQLVSQYNMVELAFSGANRVNEVLLEKPEVTNRDNTVKIPSDISEVKIENISFGYIKDNLVLDNVSINVKKGQMVALVGPTGSGKTTVMNLMNRFYDVDSGTIKFDGTDIRDFDISDLRETVGIVLQESLLFTGTIFENIAYGEKNVTKEEIIAAAKTANIHDYIMTLEEQYNTKVNNTSTIFSTGQKQLISIARTILTNPKLLILDEATSNVDTVTEASIQKAMENVLHGRTSFVIAHRLKTILSADVIIVLKDGKVIEQGNHKELLAQDGFYAELYHNQFVKK